MPRVYILSLLFGDRKFLENVIARGKNWRHRERAETLLLLDDGMPTDDVARQLGIHSRTVRTTRKSWIKEGISSLADLARSGAPKKISPEQLAKIVAAANAEPLSAKQLLAKHVEDGGLPVRLNTLRSALKASGMVWKRTRHSLKKT